MKVAGGGTLILCQAVPEDARNEALISRFEQNRLRVVRQLKYAPDRDWSIDLVFFVNGIPVATAELKSDFTQSVQDAIAQYREDRNPKDTATGRSHPLLTIKRELKGLQLTHYALKDKGALEGVAEPGQPVEGGTQRPIKGEIGDPRDRERAFLSELVEKLNELFGAEITEDDKVIFAVHITEKLRANGAVMAQVQNNPKEQALKADLPDAATEAIIEAMTSHGEMATRLLSDPDAMRQFTGLLYELLNKATGHTLLGGRNAS